MGVKSASALAWLAPRLAAPRAGKLSAALRFPRRSVRPFVRLIWLAVSACASWPRGLRWASRPCAVACKSSPLGARKKQATQVRCGAPALPCLGPAWGEQSSYAKQRLAEMPGLQCICIGRASWSTPQKTSIQGKTAWSTFRPEARTASSAPQQTPNGEPRRAHRCAQRCASVRKAYRFGLLVRLMAASMSRFISPLAKVSALR